MGIIIVHTFNHVNHMARRFSRLKYAINALRTSEDQTTPPSLPVGSPLDSYQKYLAGDTNPNYTRDTNSLPGSIDEVAIKPFGYPIGDDNYIKVAFSERAKNADALAPVIAACNHIPETTASGEGLRIDGYKPSKAIVTHKTSDTPSTETSQITGLSYKTKPRVSYTFPYGRTTTLATEFQVREAITAVINGTTFNNYSVNYNTEEL